MSDIIACTPRTLQAEDEETPAGPLHLSAVTKKIWGGRKVRLTVGFIDTTPRDLRAKIMSHLNAWNRTANVKFTETDNADDAEVRINRETAPDRMWNGYWSYLGTDILDNEGPFGQTMNLEKFTMQTPDAEFYRVVRHEAGHTLGFPHEHMREDLIARIDRDKAISYYRRLTGWSERQVIQQVLTPLDESELTGTDQADQYSIMAYQVPGSVTEDGEPIAGGLDISATDYAFAAQIYPK